MHAAGPIPLSTVTSASAAAPWINTKCSAAISRACSQVRATLQGPQNLLSHLVVCSRVVDRDPGIMGICMGSEGDLRAGGIGGIIGTERIAGAWGRESRGVL
jgi:hypothetical protein